MRTIGSVLATVAWYSLLASSLTERYHFTDETLSFTDYIFRLSKWLTTFLSGFFYNLRGRAGEKEVIYTKA